MPSKQEIIKHINFLKKKYPKQAEKHIFEYISKMKLRSDLKLYHLLFDYY